ncbi:MAG: hypothetical protein NTX64_06300 [Elusimicrobia bacterium]|nr:hypothetical protein [Elusimicrobiota bacterium]
MRVIQGLEDPAALIAAVRQAEGIAAVVMLEPLPAAWAETLAQAFEKEGIFLRVVASEDAKKRSAAVDLLVELMLLSGQAKG